MANLNIDISGRRGLLERYQGDLNDTVSKPNLRYIGEEGQFAEGIFNPMKVYGYLNPANANFADLTGTIADNIISIQYDAEADIVYLAEGGENILQLAGMNDTSLANYLSITAGFDIKDMLLYEMNGALALLYAIDTNSATTGSYVGFKSIDTESGIYVLDMHSGDSSQTSDIILDNDTNYASILAQKFLSSDIAPLEISGVRVRLKKVAGSATYNIKVAIRANADPSTSPYTSKGAWVTATGYVKDDTVTNNGTTYQCMTAHTSDAAREPGVGASWRSSWAVFGSPSGSDLASATISSSDLTGDYEDYSVFFGSNLTLTASTIYWIELEQSGGGATNADQIAWVATDGGGTLYSNGQAKRYVDGYWLLTDGNADDESYDFSLILNRDDDWSTSVAVGNFDAPTGETQWLYLAENALVYWIVGNKIHTIDGGTTGGAVGRINEELLTFPSYLQVTDVAETRSRMYIGLNDKTTDGSNKYNPAREAGVFLWDRRSQVFGSTDYYRATGAREIKKVFKSSDGDVKIITVGNSGFSEIRAISGNQFAVIHTFEREGYPVSRRAVTQIDGLTIWTGKNGIKYAYGSCAVGEPEQLYKIGTEAGEYGANPVQGAIFAGNENAVTPQMAVLTAWKDDAGKYVQKWYPNGVGTINSVAQIANQGNVYTKVYEFGMPVNIKWAHVFALPIDGAADTTTVATIKWYFNKSATAGGTLTVKRKDLSKGYIYIPIGEKNVFAIQFEIEWDTAQTLGSYDFQPSNISVDYDDTIKKKK